MSSKTPFQFLTELKALNPVYGPGRFAYTDRGVMVTKSVRPGVKGFPKPSAHCSSFTNVLMAAFSGIRPEEFTPRGNMVSLFDLTEKPSGPYPWVLPWNKARRIQIRAFGDQCTAKGIMDARGLQALLTPCCRERLFLCGESTKRSGGGWKWWHHTSAFLVLPDGRIFRAAADGFRRRNGSYSQTPFYFRELTEDNFRRLQRSKRFRVYEFDWRDFRGEVFNEGT